MVLNWPSRSSIGTYDPGGTTPDTRDLMRRFAALALAASLLLGACTDDDPTLDLDASPSAPTDTIEPTTDPPEPSETETGEEDVEGTDPEDVDLRADLTADTEVPGPGDDGGSGTFTGTLELGEAAGELCYTLEVSGLSTTVDAAHIHRGAAGESGEVVIPLEAPVEGRSDGCTAVDAVDFLPLLERPEDFYVNVHTESHPDGAVRGQLESNS